MSDHRPDIVIEKKDGFKEKAGITIQSFGLAVLTWLSTNISDIKADIKELNVTMATIVSESRNNKEDIQDLMKRLDEKDKNDQALRIRMWDAINSIRDLLTKNKIE